MKRQHAPTLAQRELHPLLTTLVGRALIGLILVVALLATCTGCSRPAGSPTPTIGSGESIAVITDPDTGCQYLGVYGSAITKRVDANGYTHMGCRGIAQ